MDSPLLLKSPNMEYLKNRNTKNKTYSYMESLDALLQSRAVGKGEPITHTRMLSPTGSFCIESTDENNFWASYCNIVFAGQTLGLTEMAQKYGPWRQDYDWKVELNEGKKRKYDENFIKEVISINQEIIRDSVALESFDEKMLYAVLLEKSSPRVEDGMIKDGFHLHFPHFIIDNTLADGYFRDRQIEKFKEAKTFEKIGVNYDLGKLVDKISKKAWLMYGSCKAEKTTGKSTETWKLKKMYDGDLEEISMQQCFDIEYNELKSEGKDKPIRYYLPRFLSIRGKNSSVQLVDSVRNKPKRKPSKFQTKTRTLEDALGDLKTIEDGRIMEMLSENRADDYNQWMDVGWTLFNIGQGHDMALEMWTEFSKKSDKYKEGVCEEQWDQMVCKETDNGCKTIASILAMAKIDSPDEYNKWKDLNIRSLLYDSIAPKKPTHYGVAKVFCKMYENQFVCANSKGDIWYEFKNHRWHCVDNGIALKKLFPEELKKQYLAFKNHITEEFSKGKLDAEQSKKKEEKIWKVIESLEDMPFMDKLLKACQIKFYDGKFLERIDENRDLLGFENGVFDFKTHNFRDGRPDDYVTMSTGISYKMFDQNDQEVKDLMDYLEKVFVNPKLRYYFLDFIFTCVRGCNYNKLFMIFSGESGDNSKSVLVKLLEKVFGDYRHNFPRETFLMGRGNTAGSARPDLARVRGKRIAFAKELAKNEDLNIGVIKEMTGNDSFFARNLYEKGTDINPMFTLICMCNTPPKVPVQDQATWNRIRILPFESWFPKDASKVPKTIEEQKRKKIFPRDEAFAEKLTELVEPFIWLILDRSREYAKHGLVEPEEVFMATENYKTRNDVYKQFVQDKLEQVEDDTKHISLTELYQVFKDWYSENFPSYTKDKIGKMTLKTEMIKILEEPNDKNKWVKWQFKHSDEDEDVPSSSERKKLLPKNSSEKNSPKKKESNSKKRKPTVIPKEVEDNPEEGL